MTDSRVCGECESPVDDTLHRLRAGRGITAAHWLWASAPPESGHVLVDAGRITVHASPGEPSAVIPARPGALPLADRSVPALVVGPILPELRDLDEVFAEFRRVLRPRGLLMMLVPDGPPLGLRAHRLRRRLRACWAHRSAVDHPDWLLTAADFAVMGDDRVVFHDVEARVSSAARVGALCAAGLLPRSLPADLRADLARQRAVRVGRVALRRLVARR